MFEKLIVPLVALFVLVAAPVAVAAGCIGHNFLADRSPEYRAALDKASATHPYSQGRFFQVTKGDAKSIIFGTIHLPDPDVAVIPPRLEMEIRRAERVFIEVTEMEEQRMQRALLTQPKMIRNAEGRRISDIVSGGEMEALAIALNTRGLTKPVFDRLEPWFLNLMVAVPQCVAQNRTEGVVILDRLIERSAERAEVPVEGLETFDDVLGILTDGSYEDQVAYLLMGLPMIEQASDALEVTKQLYLAGEIAKIWEFSRMEAERVFGKQAVQPIFENSYDKLVTTRNQNWLSALMPAMEEGGAVVAVGALHLGGRSGLLPMFEDAGFTITAISE